MSTEFALDLRLARKKSGLTQRDCAHLLNVHASKVSALEHGKQLPTLIEICTLSLIYGRSFEAWTLSKWAQSRCVSPDFLRARRKSKANSVDIFVLLILLLMSSVYGVQFPSKSRRNLPMLYVHHL